MSADIRLLRRDFLWHGSAAPVYRLDTGALPDKPIACSICIGAFDGLHLGHRRLLGLTIADARDRGVPAVAVTFDPDPDCVVGPGPAPKLMASADRIAGLASSGVDAVLVVPFDDRLAALGHAEFFRRALMPILDVRSVHVGSDFRLGSGGTGTVDVLAAWGASVGVDVMGHDLVLDDGAPITATRIRWLLASGDLDAVERELGRNYFIRGTVVTGRGEGTKMGFPTANIRVPGHIQRPAAGVYAGFALEGGNAWPAAINVGVPPMFEGEKGAAELEANFLGFDGDLYGSDIALLFCKLLRPQHRFDSVEELIAAVKANIEDVRELYGDTKEEIGF